MVFTSFVKKTLAATTLLSLGLPLSTHANTSQALIKAPNSPAVYWVQNGLRRPFPLQSVYESWYGSSFSGVSTVTPEQLAAYPLGKNVLFNKGSLIKLQTDPKVYLVADDAGALEWIKTEADFAARGFSFKQVRDIPDTFFPDYKVVEQPNFATPQNGAPQNPGTSTPSNNETQAPQQITLSPVSVTIQKGSATFSFTTSQTASATLAYKIDGAATSTITLAAGTTFTKTITTTDSTPITYTVTATAGTESRSVSGSFVSYSDITVTPLAGLVAPQAPLLTPITTVGGFTIKNNASTGQVLRKIVISFESSSQATTNVSKQITIFERAADGTLGANVFQKSYGSGTAIINLAGAITMHSEDLFAAGQSKTYVIKIDNLDAINLDQVVADDTFKPKIELVEFEQSLSVYNPTPYLATLTYTRP